MTTTSTTPTVFTIMVSRSPFDSRNAESALAFCYAALALGHKVSQVFFYQTGVHNASRFLSPNNDEVHLYKGWLELSSRHQIVLNVCVTAASRRGIVTDSEVEKLDANLKEPFVQVGLSAYFQSLADNSVNIQL